MTRFCSALLLTKVVLKKQTLGYHPQIVQCTTFGLEHRNNLGICIFNKHFSDSDGSNAHTISLET